tara:strand:- start:1775 stop:2500 length:726 start_codon:yes stop_codon:yes gene_type:complete
MPSVKIFIFLIIFHLSCTAKPLIHYIGSAYESRSDIFLYSEEYKEFESNRVLHAKSTYLNINNKIIAEKNIKYLNSLAAPNFTFSNHLTGVNASVKVTDSVNISYRSSFASKTKSVTLPKLKNLVVDSGFHYFIQDHWDSLLNKNSVVINYVSPSRLGIMPLVIKFHSKIKTNTQTIIVYKIESTSFILRFFVSPIYLHYDINSRRLLRFEGISNIKLKSGAKHVRLNFNYDILERGLNVD